jgi:glycosyltransferase involved in cell wall biosynthesis
LAPLLVALVKMKILLVHNTYQEAGGEDIAFEQERQLLENHGHRTIAYVRSNDEMEQYSAFQRITLLKRIISAKDSKNEIRGILRAEKPDLVHVHNTFLMVSPSVYEACREAAVPVLQTLHNYRLLCPAASLYRDGHVCEECRQRGLWRSVLHGCYRDSRATTAAVASMLQVHRQRRTWQESVSGYLALTQFTRQKFIEGGLPGEKIYVKPHFVHPDPGERSAPGNSALFAARLSQEKGISTLLRAWECLRSSIPLVIVGDGPLRQQLEAEAAEKNLRDVTFRGQLSVSETRAAIKRAAFLIVPSVCYETFSMNIVEAYACGTPVLCSRLGALQENVADHRTGLHFTPGDVEDLAQKVEWAWTHPAELAAMGREARREYETRYTPERNYSLLMDIYQRTVNAYA